MLFLLYLAACPVFVDRSLVQLLMRSETVPVCLCVRLWPRPCPRLCVRPWSHTSTFQSSLVATCTILYRILCVCWIVQSGRVVLCWFSHVFLDTPGVIA